MAAVGKGKKGGTKRRGGQRIVGPSGVGPQTSTHKRAPFGGSVRETLEEKTEEALRANKGKSIKNKKAKGKD